MSHRFPSMPNLSFTTVAQPQGQTNGRFSPWVIRWQLQNGAGDGFILQHMQVIFQGVHDCDDEILTDDDVWNRFEYPDPPRLNFWEAWQYRNGVWQRPADTDGWGFSRPGTFYSNDGEGVVIFKGSAGFYEGNDPSAFCGGWGTNGDNDSSPMSGDLMSTTQTPNLPEPPSVDRTMTVEWHVCNCDSDDEVCRKTAVTTTIGPADDQEG